MLIDESTILCPFRVVQREGTRSNTFSDHNSIFLNFEVPRFKQTHQEYNAHCLVKPDGYSTMSTIFNEECDKMSTDQESQELYNEFERLIDETLDQSFLKTKKQHSRSSFDSKIDHKFKSLCKKLTQFASRGKVQRTVAAQYRTRIEQANTELVAVRNRDKLQQRVANLTENDKFSAQKFWKTKKSIMGSQASCNSVFNQNGREVFDTEDIIEAYRSEFDNRLSSVEIKATLTEYKARMETLCNEIIKTTSAVKVPDFTQEELNTVVSKLKHGKAHGPDKRPAEVYIHGGDKLRNLMLKVLNNIKNSHITPEQWEMMLITTIYKSKGSRKNLVNQRGIFLTQVLCKIWERLIMERAKPTTTNINKLQAGSTQNKSGADQVFLLRSCTNHAKYMKQPLYLNFYDFRQCFDKLWLEDSIISLFKLGLNNELLALIYKTNYKARITVKTPLGNSESFTKTSLVKQGSVTASCLCSASTGEFCDENKDGGVPIGKYTLSTLAYVDDMLLMNNNVVDSNKSHSNMCFFADKKKIPLNESKCYMLPVNCKKTDPIPIQHVNSQLVEVQETVKYLGDIFNQKGDYSDLITDRSRKGTVCTVNAMALCNDAQMGKYAITSLILLYKTVFLPTILFNSETWNHLTKHDKDKLNISQNKFLKWMLHCPKSTCTSFTLLELGLLPVDHEIVYRKLSYLHHILNLPDNDPVKIVFNEQKQYTHENNWYNEIRKILEEHQLNFTEDDISKMSKQKWKGIIKEAIRNSALHSLYKTCTQKSKTAQVPPYDDLLEQTYFKYLSPKEARMYFQLRAGVYDIRANRRYMYPNDTCRLCDGGVEDTDHILNICDKIHRTYHINNIFTTTETTTRELIRRMIQFEKLIEKKTTDSQES